MTRAAASFVLVSAGLVLALIGDESPVPVALAATTAFAAIAVLAMAPEYRAVRAAAALSPAGLLLASCIVFYGLGALDLAQHGSYSGAAGPEDLYGALLYAVLGCGFVAIGFSSGRRSWRRSIGESQEFRVKSPQVQRLTFGTLILLGNIGNLLFFNAFGGLWSSPLRHGLETGASNLGLYFALSLQLNVAAALGLAYWKYSRAARAGGAVALVCLVGYGLLGGGRSPLVSVAITVAVVIAARTGGRSLLRAGAQGLAVVLVMYAATLWRFSQHEEVGVKSLNLRDNTVPYISESTATYVAVMRSVPDRLDYQGGKTFLTAVVGMVPTILWPGKHAHRVAADQIVADEILDKRGQTLTPPTLFGEMYLNFGAVGIVVGGLITGFAGATLQRRFRSGINRPADLALAALLAPEVCLMVRGPFANHAIAMALLWVGWRIGSRGMEASNNG